MIRPPRPRHFRDKVTLLVAVASGAAVLLVSGLLSWVAYAGFKREAWASASAQAQLVALIGGAPLAFGDPEAGGEALAVLRAAPKVASASLFDTQGAVFAEYRRSADPAPRFDRGSMSTRVQEGWLVVSLAVVDRDVAHGSMQLVYDLGPLRARLLNGLLVSLAATLAAMVLGYLIGQRISRSLVRPIKELSTTANQVSRSKDYALRAQKISDDELGSLTDAFNEMLSQIENQERELAAAQRAREALLEAERSARTEAERASRVKDEFVATLSHELRTPLTPIMGWVAILRHKGFTDPQVVQGLEVIERNARAQTQIIEDLLDISRIVSGKVRLDVQTVDLAEVIEAGLSTARTAADAREITLGAQLDPAVRPIRGDPGRLQQIVWNLLSNAIKFTARGGRVQISLAQVGSQIEIVVADNGQGIAAEFLPLVFDRFRQADSSTTRRYGGLGLGLAIVKQLVELHGGSVSVHSEGLGHGARFTVALPVAAIHSAEPVAVAAVPRNERAGGSAKPALSLAGLRLLVVDDEPDARAMIAVLLEARGAAVIRAGSADEAMRAMQDRAMDLIISDIGMPEVDGYELVRRLRRLPVADGGQIPAIALTAFARGEDRTRALLAGYQLHLAKPIEPAELFAAVASLVGAAHRAPEDLPAG